MPFEPQNDAQRERLERLMRWLDDDEHAPRVPPSPITLSDPVDFIQVVRMGRRVRVGSYFINASPGPSHADMADVDAPIVWLRTDTQSLFHRNLTTRAWNYIGPAANYTLEYEMAEPEEFQLGSIITSIASPGVMYIRRVEGEGEEVADVARREGYSLGERTDPTYPDNSMTPAARRIIEGRFEQDGQLVRYIVLVTRERYRSHYEVLSGPYRNGESLRVDLDSMRVAGYEGNLLAKRLLAHEAESTCQHCVRPRGFDHQRVCRYSQSL